MSVVKELVEMPDGTPGFDAVLLPPPDDVLPQAAATRAAEATSVIRPIFDRSRDPWPLIPFRKRIRPVPSVPDHCHLRRFFAPVAIGAAHISAHLTFVRRRRDLRELRGGLSTPR